MYNKNRSPSSNSKQMNHIWALNKSHNRSKLDRSMFKRTIKNNSISFNPIETTPPVSKIIPSKYQTQATSSSFPQTEPLHKIVGNPSNHNQNTLHVILETESKIDQLLKHKLKLLVLMNKRRLANKYKNESQDIQLVNQMNAINNQISSLMQNIKNKMNITSNIEGQYERKINIIEKMIAENESEGDIAKRHFHNFCQNSTTYKSFHNSPPKDQGIINKTNSCFSLPRHRKTSLNSNQQVIFNSTSKISYKSPNPEDYQKYRYKQVKTQNNDEPIIRTSSYKSSFPHLTPPRLPSQDFTNKRASSFFNQSNTKMSVSSYKHQFQPIKQQQKVDYKKLDCYKNKFKNLKMNWQPKRQASSMNANKDYLMLLKNQSCLISRRQSKCSESFSKYLPETKSSYHRSFEMGNEERKLQIIKPKNKRLNALRVSYRQLCNQN